jgi:Ca-activated chloride channel homolog
VYAQTDPLNAAVRYFKIEISRAGIEALPVLPKSLVFMLDSSESMTTAKLRRFCQGVEKAIDLLNPGDTFNIITFRDSVSSCFPDLAPANSTYKARARAFLQNLTARGAPMCSSRSSASRASPRLPPAPCWRC